MVQSYRGRCSVLTVDVHLFCILVWIFHNEQLATTCQPQKRLNPKIHQISNPNFYRIPTSTATRPIPIGPEPLVVPSHREEPAGTRFSNNPPSITNDGSACVCLSVPSCSSTPKGVNTEQHAASGQERSPPQPADGLRPGESPAQPDQERGLAAC